VDLVRIFVRGSVYYVDVRLQQFVNYGSDADGRETVHRALTDRIRRVPFYPLPQLKEDSSGTRSGLAWPLGRKASLSRPELFTGLSEQEQSKVSQGYFLILTPSTGEDWNLPTAESTLHQSWESVVDTLGRTSSMSECTFFLIAGFHRVRSRWRLRNRRIETVLRSSDDGWASAYLLPMGRIAVLKLLFYRPDLGIAGEISPRTIDVRTEGDVFSSVSHKKIHISSRYNEERLLFACKRVFDSVLAAISLEPLFEDEGNPGREEVVLAPRPYLLVAVRVPKSVVFWILLGLATAPLFLTAGPDLLRDTGKQLTELGYEVVGYFFETHALLLAGLSKAFAITLTLVAGYLGFRRLPVGK
jgi:hypothetical protein